MIVDCFPFYNEFDILEMRLTLLDDVVDRFVLCEAAYNYRGLPKPLWFAENAERYARWHHKLVHLVVPFAGSTNPWENEWHQRAFLGNGIVDAQAGDLILYGDVDEIPHPKNVAERPPPGRILGHRQRLSIGYINRVETEEGWVGTRAIHYGDIAALGTLNEVRRSANQELGRIVDGGWHFSSLGGTATMLDKVHNNSHRELDVPYYTDPRRLDLEMRQRGFYRPLEDDAPAFLRDPRWDNYLWPKPELERDDVEALAHAHGCFAYVPDGAARVAAVTDVTALWTRAGSERFGSAFAGVAPAVSDWLPRLEPGAWLAVDGFERVTDAELAGALRGGIRIAAYARNARSHEAIAGVMSGEPFPAGRTWGLPEMKARIAESGAELAVCDTVVTRAHFASPDIFPAEGTFERFIWPVRLLATTREGIVQFLAHAFVLVFESPSSEGRRTAGG